MATNNRKDNHFLLFSTSLLSFLELSSVKYLETRQFCENDFRQYFNLKKWNIYLQDSQKCYSFLILIKKKKSLDKIVKKLYCEVGIYTMKYANFHKISTKETQEKWAHFLRLHVCDCIQFWDDHESMRIRGPMAPVTCSKNLTTR